VAPAWADTRLLVAVGDVAPTTAVLWARGTAEGELIVEYGPAGEATRARARLGVSRARDLTGQVVLRDLRPATRYVYHVRGDGGTTEGEFVTAPPAAHVASTTFVWGGDLGSGEFCRPRAGGYRIFEAMAARRPHFFLFVGDTIYADSRCHGEGVVPGGDFVATTLDGYRRKHRYNREDPALLGFLTGTSVYPIWDDHEVRNDFAGPAEPLMPAGRQAFLEYWPLQPPAEEPTRLYRRFRWGRLLEVFILDTRQYRSPNREPDGPAKTMLGTAQRRWLLDGVTASTAVWKVVVTSVSLSVTAGKTFRDSWPSANVFGIPDDGTGFAAERDAMLRAWRERGVTNLVFLAADVHHAELIRHQPAPGFSFHEFIAGPLGAGLGRPRSLDVGLNPRSLFARGGTLNFGEVTIEPALLTVRIFDGEGRVLHTHTIRPE
jgi:alkaline phosphatase D